MNFESGQVGHGIRIRSLIVSQLDHCEGCCSTRFNIDNAVLPVCVFLTMHIKNQHLHMGVEELPKPFSLIKAKHTRVPYLTRPYKWRHEAHERYKYLRLKRCRAALNSFLGCLLSHAYLFFGLIAGMTDIADCATSMMCTRFGRTDSAWKV